MTPFLLAAGAMFAVMYSTQAILPELGREFGVSPSQAGLSISVVIAALALGGWFWGPLSDRIGRRASLVLASGAIVVPTLLVALAPSFEALLALRALQGLCMPGLLTVGVPYVTEAYSPSLGARAMGYYIAALVAGGLVGRVGVALLTAATRWRVALARARAAAARLHAADAPRPARGAGRRAPARRRSRARSAPRAGQPRGCCAAMAAGAALFFAFLGDVLLHRLPARGPPFSLAPAVGGARLPGLGRGRGRARSRGGVAERGGWQRSRSAAWADGGRAAALAARGARARDRRARARDAGELLRRHGRPARRRGLDRAGPRAGQRALLQRLLRRRRRSAATCPGSRSSAGNGRAWSWLGPPWSARAPLVGPRAGRERV